MLFRLNNNIKYKDLESIIGNDSISEILLKIGNPVLIEHLNGTPRNPLVNYNKISKDLLEEFINYLDSSLECVHSSSEYRELVDATNKIRVIIDSDRSFIKIVKPVSPKLTLEDLLEG